jgi:DNA-binding phage protein
MKKIKTYTWDTAKFLRDEKDILLYLETMFEDGTPEEIAEAIGTRWLERAK